MSTLTNRSTGEWIYDFCACNACEAMCVAGCLSRGSTTDGLVHHVLTVPVSLRIVISVVAFMMLL